MSNTHDPDAERNAAETTLTQIDRTCSQYLQKQITADAAMQQITRTIAQWTDPDGFSPVEPAR